MGVTFQDIQAARKRIAGSIVESPCPASIPLSEATGIELVVVPVENLLFGPTVTVTGLLSSDSILEAVGAREWDAVFLPSITMRDEKDTFIDGMTLREFKKKLPCPVYRVDSSARGLIRALKKVVKG